MHHLQCSVLQEDINCDSSSFQQLCRTETLLLICYLTFSGSRKLLCKETCEEGNILIDTYGDEDQRGRYSIKYEHRYIGSSILDVTITKLTKSDSGCHLFIVMYPLSRIINICGSVKMVNMFINKYKSMTESPTNRRECFSSFCPQIIKWDY
uniref:Uncharacterized protein n=1 Tax=Oryzias sinensis TaxID=183150 RepID=A0A8C7XDK6_9TELE